MYYAQMGIRGDDNIVAMDSWPGHNGTNCTDISDPVLVLMTAGKNYAGLNNTQCSITLNQTLFEININTTSRTITVNPTSAPAVDLDPTGRVACLTALTGVQLCLINTSLYTSTLGDMFASNIENVRSQHSSSANETDYTMRGIADTLMSLIDDALVAYASAQLMIAKDTTATSAMVDFKALQIGDRRYIYAIGILNVCIILLFLAGTVKTSGWKGLSRFNYVDVKTVVIGTSMGGNAIGNAARDAHREMGSSWKGDGADRMVGRMPVVIGYRNGLALVPPADAEYPLDRLNSGLNVRKPYQPMSASVEELLAHPSRRDQAF